MIFFTAVKKKKKKTVSHLALPLACCHIDVALPFMEDFSKNSTSLQDQSLAQTFMDLEKLQVKFRETKWLHSEVKYHKNEQKKISHQEFQGVDSLTASNSSKPLNVKY